MKRLLLASLLLGFISPAMAKKICTLTSEVEPDVTITLQYTGSSYGVGTLNYKNKPGKLRALMPLLAQVYYYPIPVTEKGQYGRQKLSKEMKTILDSSEGFFVDSGGCSKFFGYGGN